MNPDNLPLNISTHLLAQFLKFALPLPSILNLKRLNLTLTMNNLLSIDPPNICLQFHRTRSRTFIFNSLFLRLISWVNCILNNLITRDRCVTLLVTIWLLEFCVTCKAYFLFMIFLRNKYLVFTKSILLFRQTHIRLVLNILKTNKSILLLNITILLAIFFALHRFILTQLFIRQN